MKVVFKVMSEDTLKRQRQEDEEKKKEEEPLTKIHWVSIAISGGAVTMLALAILLYLLFNNREAELTQVTTTPSSPQQQTPISDLEMSMTLTKE